MESEVRFHSRIAKKRQDSQKNKPPRLTAAQARRAAHMKSLIRQKSRKFVDYGRSKSRITAQLIAKSMRRKAKFARGGVPWFILTVSCVQIANFVYMYKSRQLKPKGIVCF